MSENGNIENIENVRSGSPGERDDGLFSGQVFDGLEKLRKKLLDLSTRNRLLNFRHTKKSSLRIIDELPDFLASGLLDGDTFEILPVDEPRQSEIDYWKSENEYDLDEALSIEPSIPVEWVAKYRGLNTDYEMPLADLVSAQGANERHADQKIQTLLYPKDLDASLGTISRAAKLAEEESGANMLYLALGFLEWREKKESSATRLAPLVLVPVSIDRGPTSRKTGYRRYNLTYSGDDIATNASLKQRLLNDFDLELPEYQDGQSPEAYFDSLDHLFVAEPSWKLRRFVTLSLFQFGKILMYLDLAPERWPGSHSMADNDLVRQFFEGTPGETEYSTTDYEDLDSRKSLADFPLIDRADSTQHSALVDAVEGKNLVIEGPPGTGKSQTITNLIAASLARGKSILFVSEKLAALEVVRRRMDRVGLGHFCLELHSHKTQKRGLLDDIEKRLTLKGSFKRPKKIEEERDRLEVARSEIQRMSFLLNQQWNETGLSIQQILQNASKYRDHLDKFREVEIESEVQDIDKFDVIRIDQHEALVESFQSFIEEIEKNEETVLRHPWRGCCNAQLTPLDYPDVYKLVSNLKSALAELKDATGHFAQIGYRVPDCTTQELEQIGTACADIVSRSLQTEIPPYFESLHEEQIRRDLGSFCQLVRGILKKIQKIIEIIPNYANEAEARLEELGQSLQAVLHHGVSVAKDGKELVELASALQYLGENAPTVEKHHSSILRELGTTQQLVFKKVKPAFKVFELLTDAPLELLHHRAKPMERKDARKIVELALQASTSLIGKRSELQVSFMLNLLPSLDELKSIYRVISGSNLFSVFSGDYRRSRRSLLGVMIAGGKLRKAELLSGLVRLIGYLEELEAFNSNEAFREIAGSLFEGIDTDFEKLLVIVDWVQSVGRRLGPGELSRMLLEGETASLIAASEMVSVGEVFADVQAFSQNVDEVGRLDPGLTATFLDRNVISLVSEFKSVAEAVSSFLGQCSSFGIADRQPIEKIEQALSLASEVSRDVGLLDESGQLQSVLGDAYKGIYTDVEVIEKAIALANGICSGTLDASIRRYLFSSDAQAKFVKLGDLADQLLKALSDYLASISFLYDKCEIRDVDWISGGLEEQEIALHEARFNELTKDTGQLDRWLRYIRQRQNLVSDGLSMIVEGFEAGLFTCEECMHALRGVLYDCMARSVLKKTPELRKFDMVTHENLIRRYRDIDERLQDLTAQEMQAALDSKSIPAGNGTGRVATFSQLSLLQHEIAKQKRHIPIRDLVNRAGKALVALKPCFMMGPLSVAQYLAPGQLEFDLLVMDEASQIRPEDALGAIARAKQVVIVGDSKQLPPTSFFDRIFEAEEDLEERTIAEGAESVLDVASWLFKPSRRLKWHYRSRHESLIQFSNVNFYDEDLIVFPSPRAASEGLGVHFNYVAGGKFQSRTNVKEALAIVDHALALMEGNSVGSMGIVTMNNPQAELIERLLLDTVDKSPVAREWYEMREQSTEPVFVKNLENVQGDERDTMMISMTYGQDQNGKVRQQFGPINGADGWRRLNVLFTRARRRVEVFSSMKYSDVIVDERSARGRVALRDYLQFAETGQIASVTYTGKGPDSAFEETVARRLSSYGYEVVPQVGVAGFFIDIGVKDPDNPGDFVVGIECDGAAFHSGKSVRDRDRLRQGMLEDLGWTIVRVWSTDWYFDPDKQVHNIVEAIEEVRAKRNRKRQQQQDQSSPIAVSNEENTGQDLEKSVSSRKRLRISVNEAREKLIDLRENEINVKYPRHSRESGLLRRQMLEEFLKRKPGDDEEFMQFPLKLRQDTDGTQRQEYLEAVLDILADIEE